MKLKKIFTLSILLFMPIIFITCYDRSMETEEKKIKKMLHSHFSIGDSRQKFDSLLSKIDLHFTYDRHSNKYRSLVRDGNWGPYKYILVSISFDETNKISEILVRRSYTMP